MKLSDKRIIVTGAGAGMGEAGIRLFRAEGAKLAAIDVDGTALAALEAELPGLICIQADLGDPDAVAAAIEKGAQKLGGLDGLWSHAGMNGPASVEDMDPAAYDATVALNLTASVRAVSAALPFLRDAGGGAILLTSSVAGLVGSIQSPIYSATKHGVIGLAKSLALKYAAEGIRVNALCPGPVRTRMMEDLRAGKLHPDGPAIVERLIASIPLGRLAEPAELAEAALWLLSDASSFVTGTALAVDGGTTAR